MASLTDIDMEERERLQLQGALQNADRLNAYLSMSSIPEAAAAAQQRARYQNQERLQRRKQEQDSRELALALGMKYGSDAFKGTSMEAQMLNIMMDDSIPDDAPRKIAAKQRLERVRTVTTPEGVTTIPGYDFGGGQGGDFTPRNPSGDEKRGDLAVAQVQSAQPSGYRPGVVEEMAQEFLAPSIATLFTSEPYAMDLAEQRQLLSNTIYLQSGAAASPQEVEKRRLEFFPQSNDSDAVIAKKAKNLEAFKRDALVAFKNRGGEAPVGVDYRYNSATGKLEPAK